MIYLGGEIVSTFDTPDKVKLGKCDLIEEIIIGEDKLIKFSGLVFRCNGNEYLFLLFLNV